MHSMQRPLNLVTLKHLHTAWVNSEPAWTKTLHALTTNNINVKRKTATLIQCSS